MAKIDFPKKQEQRLIPKYLLEYSQMLQENHPDPSAEWGSSGPEYSAGTGIDITENVISIDDTVVATKNDIPDVSEFITDDDLSQALEDYELKSEAFSGSYNDLTDKPTIPTKTSDLQNDSGYITGVTWNDVTGKPTFATVATSGDYDDLIDKPDLSVYELKTEAFSGNYNDLSNKPDLSVYELKSEAFSGSYNDLTDKPTIPTKTSDLQNDSGFITGITSNMVTTALGYTPGTSNFSGDYDDLTDKPDLSIYAQSANLATVATTGSYNDLTDKPTIPDTTYMVTTNTTQTITGQKTFTGNVYITGSKLLKLKPATDYQGSFTGFTAYDTSNNEYGNLQIGKRSINFGSGASDRVIVSLGNYSTHYTGTNKPLVGFRAQDQSNTSINFVMPTTNFSTNFTGADTFYMPMMVNGTKANSDGNINIAIPDVSNYYTKTEIDNMIGDIETLLAAI